MSASQIGPNKDPKKGSIRDRGRGLIAVASLTPAADL
jgi:hypothetical protein